MERFTQDLCRQIQKDQWRPDYIVGLTRGGLVPASLISQYLSVPMETLKVSLRDSGDCESNLWMATDAFGVREASDNDCSWRCQDIAHQKQILIVDDINDSGATFNWIKQDWQGTCFPNDPIWAQIWGNNVRMAVIVDNESSACELPISYSAMSINKLEDPQWIVFPWEEWWLNT